MQNSKKLRLAHPEHVGKFLIRKGVIKLVLVIGGPSGSISCASAGPLTGLKNMPLGMFRFC
jgi:hypothetical protein